MYVYTHVYKHLCICIHMYVYTHTHTNTHTHTHTGKQMYARSQVGEQAGVCVFLCACVLVHVYDGPGCKWHVTCKHHVTCQAVCAREQRCANMCKESLCTHQPFIIRFFCAKRPAKVGILLCYRALVWKRTCKDKAFCLSCPPYEERDREKDTSRTSHTL